MRSHGPRGSAGSRTSVTPARMGWRANRGATRATAVLCIAVRPSESPVSASMLRRNLLGVLSLCAGVLIFSLQDAIIKEISGAHAVTLAVAIRGVVAIPILLVLVHWEVGLAALRSKRFWPLTARAAVLFVSYTAYYMAFPALPLADAVALYFTVPLFITAMAGPFLGEVVGGAPGSPWRLGFAGVLIMLQPGTRCSSRRRCCRCSRPSCTHPRC